MLVKAENWIRETFEEGSRPRLSTVRRWVIEKQIPGTVIDGRPYVDADRFALGDTEQKTISGLDLITGTLCGK